MKAIKELIQRAVNGAGLGKEYQQFRLKEFWSEVIPSEVISDTIFLEIEGSVFLVAVKTNASKEVLESLRGKILSRLGDEFPELSISSIKISKLS